MKKFSKFLISALSITFLFHPKILFSEDFTKSLLESLDQISSQVEEYKLSNGIPVMLYKRGDAPIFSAAIIVKVGGINEEVGKTGAAHMLEHMAFKGTTTLGTKDYLEEQKLLSEQEDLLNRPKLTKSESARLREIEIKLEELVIPNAFGKAISSLGGQDLNATTDKELTKYFVSMPKKSFAEWAKIEGDRLLNPVMRQFYKERNVVMEERRMRYENNPEGKLYENLILNAFKVHPYRHPVIGYTQDINSLRAEYVEQFHKDYYTAENIAIALSGDVSKADLVILEEQFGKIKKDTNPIISERLQKLYAVKEPKQTKELRLKVPQKSSNIVFIAYRKPTYPDRDDPPISLLEELLAGNKLSSLYKRLVEEGGLAQSVSVEEAPGNIFDNLFFFAITPRSDIPTQMIIDIFDEVVNNFKQEEINLEQLEIAKKAFAVTQLANLNSNLSIALNLAGNKLIYGDWNTGLKWLKETVNVNADEVKNIARKYLVPENRIIISIK